MLLIIHNLPNNITYNEVKDLIWKNCGLEQIILDKLVNDNAGTKRVTVGLAEESDAAILARKINGMYIDGHQLFVENIRQKREPEQPYVYSQAMQNSAATTNNLMPTNYPYNMNQYSMYYGNMQCYIPPVPNAMIQPQATSNQPIYQNNIPFYQQAQNSNSQQNSGQNPVSYQRSLRISVPNTEMSKRTVDCNTFQQQNTQQNNNVQGQYNSRSREEGYDPQYQQRSRDRDGDRDRGQNRGRNETRDRSGTHNRHEKRGGGERRDRNKFHDRDQGRDHSHERHPRDNYSDGNVWESSQNQLPPKNPFRVDHRKPSYQPTPYNPSISDSIKVPPTYEKDGQGNSNFAKNPPLLPTPGTFKQPRPNVNKQTDFASVQGKGQQRDQTGNVEGKLKRKANQEHTFTQSKKNTFDARPWQQQQRFAAPLPPEEQTQPTKRPKFEELDEHKKRTRFNGWVAQCSSTVARSIMIEGTAPKKLAGTIYKEIKACVALRMHELYKNRYPANMIQLNTEYREKFIHENTLELFNSIVKKVKGEKNATAAPGASGQHSVASNEPQNNKPAGVKKSLIKTPLKPNKDLTVIKSGKLPPYPNANKKQFKQNKETHLKEFLGCAKFNLPKLQQEALDAELKVIDDLFAAACNEVDAQLQRRFVQEWTESKEYFLRTIRIHASKRLLNQTNYLVVRVYFRPKKPSIEILHDFLRRYGVISLKKSMRRKLFVAACSSYEGYDALLSLAEYFLDGTTLRFLPLNLTGPQPEKLSRAEGRFQKYNINNEVDEAGGGGGGGGDDDDDDDDDVVDDDDDDDDDASLGEDDLEESLINNGHIEGKLNSGDTDNQGNAEYNDANTEVVVQSEIKDVRTSEHNNNEESQNENKDKIEDKESLGDQRPSDIVVGDKNYMVLDDLNDDDEKIKNDDKKQENGDEQEDKVGNQGNDNEQQDSDQINDKLEIEAADITEEDLEDF